MKKNTIIKAFATFVAGCLVMGTVGCGSGAQTKEPFVITNTVGTVMVSENGENSVSTKDDGSVDFDLDDTKKVGLDVNSSATVTADGNKKIVRLENGGLYFYTTEKVAEGEEFIIEMDSLKVRITGTSGYIIYNEKTGVAKITLSSGLVQLIGTNPVTGGTNEIDITAGASAQVCLLDFMEGSDSVRFELSKVTPADLPLLLVQKIVADPEVFDRVLDETGWSANEMTTIAGTASCVNAAVTGSDQYAAASAAAQTAAMTALDTRYERAEEAEAAGVSLVGDNEVVVSGGDGPGEASVDAVPEVAQRSADTSSADLSAIQPEHKPDNSRKSRGELEVAGMANDGIGRIEIPSGSEGNIKITDEAGTRVNVTPTGDSASDGGSSGESSSSDGDSSSGDSASGGGGGSSSGDSSGGGSSSGGSSGGGGSSSGTDSGSGTTTPASTYNVTLQFDSNKLQAWIIEEGSSSRDLTSKDFNAEATVLIGALPADRYRQPVLTMPDGSTIEPTDGDGYYKYSFAMPSSEVTATLTADPEPKYNVSVVAYDGCTFTPSIKDGCETEYYYQDSVSIVIENLPVSTADLKVVLYSPAVGNNNILVEESAYESDANGEITVSFPMPQNNVIIYFAP